jgi:hypothetical protein
MLINLKNGLKHILFFVFLLAGIHFCNAQNPVPIIDSASLNKGKESTDTSKAFRPAKIAATRSAIFPGLGQIYNKKYWKLPIVYGALVTAGFVFNYNHKNYQELRQAYKGKYNARVFKDSTEYFKIKPTLVPLSEESLRFNRDQFRRNMDFSILAFALLWGLNVLDAAVDAHLKSFDVGPDLSLQIKPGHSEMANTNGLSLVLHIGK